jgi:FKBP-type peptidyl-prolyl cis-trans isomerase (trigger factor)
MSHSFQNVKVSRDTDRWEAAITAEIPVETLTKYREVALKEIQKSAKLDGFRPGKAPLDRVLAIYGEGQVLRHAVEHAIEHELPLLLADEKLPIVEAPRVTTDTPTLEKSVTFTARAALAPEIKLADYKKIAKKHTDVKEDTSVSDTEHTEALTHLRRERARIDRIESGTEPQKAAEETKALAETDLPELDDTFVQTLGYENTAAFSAALRNNIQTEKEMRATEKRRAGILDDMVKDSTISYPVSLREFELEEMESRLTDDLSRIGQTIESYLKETNKTREELLESWKDAADKRAKVRLILAEIARQEKIEPPAAELEHELEHARQHYPKADPENLRAHIAHAMRNEMTLRFLEGNPEPVGHTAAHHSHE